MHKPKHLPPLGVLCLWWVVVFSRSSRIGCQAQALRKGVALDPVETNVPVATAALPLHAVSGTHHVHVYVGSPPQRQVLIIDTGSRLAAFPCLPCHDCGNHASEHFDPKLSTTDFASSCNECRFTPMSTCSAGKCQTTQKYTEGSEWTAYEIEDLVWLGNNYIDESTEVHLAMAVPFTFGCQTSESGLFRTQYADGIMGIAMYETSIINAFHQAGSLIHHSFSLCFTRLGGLFNLGGTSLSYTEGQHKEPMHFTPMLKDVGWYTVKVLSMSVGDIVVTTGANVLAAFNTDKGTIIDSGTTDTYLPRQVAKSVRNAWKKITGSEYSNKRLKYTYQEFKKLPTITFSLSGDVKWEIRPGAYMEPPKSAAEEGRRNSFSTEEENNEWSGERVLTNRVYLDEPKGAVLGANAMIGHDILFDISGKRIGIARATCH